MAQRVFQANSWAATGLADGSAGVNSQYMAIEGQAATTYFEVKEVSISGQASASTISLLQLHRISTVAVAAQALSIASGSDGPMRGYSVAATSIITYVSASTSGGVRSNSTAAGRLNLNINSFGGIYRWTAAPGEEWGSIGTAAQQHAMLSGYSGSTGNVGSHIVYEWY